MLLYLWGPSFHLLPMRIIITRTTTTTMLLTDYVVLSMFSISCIPLLNENYFTWIGSSKYFWWLGLCIYLDSSVFIEVTTFYASNCILQSQCTAAKTLCWNDPHPHFCWSSGPVRPHRWYYSFFSSRPIKSRLSKRVSLLLLCGLLVMIKLHFLLLPLFS